MTVDCNICKTTDEYDYSCANCNKQLFEQYANDISKKISNNINLYEEEYRAILNIGLYYIRYLMNIKQNLTNVPENYIEEITKLNQIEIFGYKTLPINNLNFKELLDRFLIVVIKKLEITVLRICASAFSKQFYYLLLNKHKNVLFISNEKTIKYYKKLNLQCYGCTDFEKIFWKNMVFLNSFVKHLQDLEEDKYGEIEGFTIKGQKYIVENGLVYLDVNESKGDLCGKFIKGKFIKKQIEIKI